MTEEQARDWIAGRFERVARERLERLTAMVAEETTRQNLIAPSTLAGIWSRHVVDSLQLIDLAPTDGAWLDIGTGGGFPGLAIAIARDTVMHLVEPRRKRAAFLEHATVTLDLPNVTVHPAKVEVVQECAEVVSARAVASVAALVDAARHVASRDTVWVLPRGRVDGRELDDVRRHARVFHVEQSITDPASSIVVLRGVSGR